MTTVFNKISIKFILKHFSYSFHPYPLNDNFLYRLPSFRIRDILRTILPNWDFGSASFLSENQHCYVHYQYFRSLLFMASLKQPDHNKTYRIAHMFFYI